MYVLTALVGLLIFFLLFSCKKQNSVVPIRDFLSRFYGLYCLQTGARNGSPQHDPLMVIYLVAKALDLEIGTCESEFRYSGHRSDGSICFGDDPKLGSETIPYVLNKDITLRIARKLMKSEFTQYEIQKMKKFFGKDSVFLVELEPYDVDNLFALRMTYNLSKVLGMKMLVVNHSVYHTPAPKPLEVKFPEFHYAVISEDGKEKDLVGTVRDMRTILDSQKSGEYHQIFKPISDEVTRKSRDLDCAMLEALCPGIQIIPGMVYDGTNGNQVISFCTHVALYKILHVNGELKGNDEYTNDLDVLRKMSPMDRCNTALKIVNRLHNNVKVTPKMTEGELIGSLSKHSRVFYLGFGGNHPDSVRILDKLSSDDRREILLFRQGGIVPTTMEGYATSTLLMHPANQGFARDSWDAVSKIAKERRNIKSFILPTNGAKGKENGFMSFDLSKLIA